MSTINTDKRIIKSKKALKEAMITLMQKKDFKEITVKDLVFSADVNRGTFYKHYQFKEDILNEIIDDVINDLIESYREPYKDMETFEISKLTSNGIKVFEHVHKYSNFYSLIVQSNILTGFQRKICDVLKNLSLQDLIVHNSNNLINRELVASYHSHAIFGMIIEWINDGFKYSPSYMAEQLLAIITSNAANSIYKSNNKEKS
ncbi:TetR/AcrR family transcriptional regulator [Bacillus sp. EAC]|uniref:TetR/AcrR family transcriptional regulator n=1 Tax=Bacillus sp. EAC TaxID=1978338 RepID=UPI000B433B39|nr:TetR/AcrR family transcriptional regulator [Bacillus sp. EAC]